MLESFHRCLDTIASAPEAFAPDKAAVWAGAWPDLANHRHVNLRRGWRLCYTVARRAGEEPLVIVVFLGTHKEYERRYGFRTG